MMESNRIGITSNDGGFLYEDTILAATLFMIMIPYIFILFYQCSTDIQNVYINDSVLQQVSNQLEIGKAEYFHLNQNGDSKNINSRFSNDERVSDMYIHNGITYISKATSVNVKNLDMLQYTVQAMKDGVVIYEASTFLLSKPSTN